MKGEIRGFDPFFFGINLGNLPDMKSIITVLILIVAMGSVFAQESEPDYSLAKVEKKNGKYVFTNAEPVQPYDVVFTIEVKVFSNSQINTVDKIENVELKKAFEISEKIGKDFDAILVSQASQDVAIKFRQ